MDEKALIRQCQKGDARAFEEQIRWFYPYISRFLLKTCGDKTLSEDLTQDTFLKMIRSIENYDIDGKAGFGTWLVTIARNCYIDYLRHNCIYLEDINELQVDSRSDIAEEISTKLQYEEVLQMIKTLPREQGLAIRLKYEEELTLEQIAKRFGVPAKTIKSRIHDGTVKLRKLLITTERKDTI